MDGQLINQVVDNTRNLSSMQNQRRSTIVRKYGEEHDADFVGDTATFYLPVDTDMEYISELKIKLVLGTIGSGGSNAGGSYAGAPHGVNLYSSFEAWITAYPVGTAVNVDGAYGAQCWDYAAAFWYGQVNRLLQTGPNHSARECWTVNRTTNAGSEFDLITDKTKIKAGDWIVFGGGNYGHIGMAAEDYKGINSIHLYGQNQGGQPMPQGGASINITVMSLENFLGAFRYKRWHS